MSEAQTAGALDAGARNCAVDCAGATPDARLFIVSERGAVEDAVVDAVSEAARKAGANVKRVWADPVPKARPGAIPGTVLDAYAQADIVISHFPSLTREALHPHFPGETRVRVPNRARTAAELASDWSRFPYGVQRTIARRLDEAMAPGRHWRITCPDGTELTGTFGAAGGEVGAAFFVDSGEGGRARRNFPGGVHSPRECSELSGVIACGYIDNVAAEPLDPPLMIEIEGAKVTATGGGDKRGAARAALEASDGWIDSFHAGVNPCTVSALARADKPRAWFGYSHCHPALMHFHLGRTHETTNLAIFDHTLEVEGRVLYDGGRLAIYEDEVVAAAIEAADMDEGLLSPRAMPRW